MKIKCNNKIENRKEIQLTYFKICNYKINLTLIKNGNNDEEEFI